MPLNSAEYRPWLFPDPGSSSQGQTRSPLSLVTVVNVLKQALVQDLEGLPIARGIEPWGVLGSLWES